MHNQVNNEVNKKYSQTKAMLAIAKASLRSILRNPSSIVFSLLFPVIFIIVFGFIGSNGFNVEVGVLNGSDRSNPIYESLTKIENIKLITDNSDEELNQKLQTGKIDALINIEKSPEGIKPVYIVSFKSNKASPESSGVFRLMLNNIIDKVNLLSLGYNIPFASVDEQLVEGRKYTTIDFILPGQLGFSILGAGVFGTAFVFISLRETLVIKRFFATPINRKFIVLGEGLSRLIFSISGAIIIILIGYFLFGFTLVNGAVTFINMLVLCAIGLMVFLGFGFVVSNVAANLNAVPPLANLVTLPQFLLAGTFFSIDAFPSWLQPISRALPLTYLNSSLRKVAFEGASLFDVGGDILIMLAWGVVVYAIAIKFFKWE